MVLIPMRQLRHLNSQLADGVGLVRPDEGVVHVNTDDAERLGINDGAMVMVTSATGSLTGVARVGDLVRPGVVAVPHGYADPHVGELTTTATDVDPLTGMVLMSGVEVDLALVGAG
jgi:assimilatory nitrate reductase catalytic subunit